MSPHFKVALGLFAVIALIVGSVTWTITHQTDHNAKFDADVATSKKVEAQHSAQDTASARVDTVLKPIYLRAGSLEASGERLRKAADTLGQHALTLRDTAEMYHLRWVMVGLAYDSLKASNDTLHVAVDSLTADRARWHSVADSAVRSMIDLRKDLGEARKGCRFLGFIPCQSRKTVFVEGGLAGAGIVGAVIYFRKHSTGISLKL